MVSPISVAIGATLSYGPTCHLGSQHNLDLSVRPVYEGPVSSKSSYVSLVFIASKNGRRVKRIEWPVGMSTQKPPYCFKVGRFLGKSVRQVFVSVYHQRIISGLLKFDGKSVQKIYYADVGRVWTQPKWNRKGRFYIEELLVIPAHYENGKHLDNRQVKNSIYFTKDWKPIPGPYSGW